MIESQTRETKPLPKKPKHKSDSKESEFPSTQKVKQDVLQKEFDIVITMISSRFPTPSSST
jgi:hypothetical protein